MKNRRIFDYYDESWLPRFRNRHNPASFAIHLGYFEDENSSNDDAKLEMNKYLAELLLLPSNNDKILTIVDAGCGVGGTCIYLARNYKHLNIIGVNIHNNQILFAKELVEKFGLQNTVKFLNEDYAQTSLPDNSVDTEFAMESMCHALDKEKLIKEIYRVLKPNGVCLFFDYFVTVENTGLLDDAAKELLNDFETGWAVEHYPFITLDESIKKNGFSKVESFSLTNKVLPGINLSYRKAIDFLEKENNHKSTFAKHFKANVALKKLVDMSVIDYRVIKAIK